MAASVGTSLDIIRESEELEQKRKIAELKRAFVDAPPPPLNEETIVSVLKSSTVNWNVEAAIGPLMNIQEIRSSRAAAASQGVARMKRVAETRELAMQKLREMFSGITTAELRRILDDAQGDLTLAANEILQRVPVSGPAPTAAAATSPNSAEEFKEDSSNKVGVVTTPETENYMITDLCNSYPSLDHDTVRTILKSVNWEVGSASAACAVRDAENKAKILKRLKRQGGVATSLILPAAPAAVPKAPAAASAAPAEAPELAAPAPEAAAAAAVPEPAVTVPEPSAAVPESPAVVVEPSAEEAAPQIDLSANSEIPAELSAGLAEDAAVVAKAIGMKTVDAEVGVLLTTLLVAARDSEDNAAPNSKVDLSAVADVVKVLEGASLAAADKAIDDARVERLAPETREILESLEAALPTPVSPASSAAAEVVAAAAGNEDASARAGPPSVVLDVRTTSGIALAADSSKQDVAAQLKADRTITVQFGCAQAPEAQDKICLFKFDRTGPVDAAPTQVKGQYQMAAKCQPAAEADAAYMKEQGLDFSGKYVFEALELGDYQIRYTGANDVVKAVFPEPGSDRVLRLGPNLPGNAVVVRTSPTVDVEVTLDAQYAVRYPQAWLGAYEIMSKKTMPANKLYITHAKQVATQIAAGNPIKFTLPKTGSYQFRLFTQASMLGWGDYEEVIGARCQVVTASYDDKLILEPNADGSIITVKCDVRSVDPKKAWVGLFRTSCVCSVSSCKCDHKQYVKSAKLLNAQNNIEFRRVQPGAYQARLFSEARSYDMINRSETVSLAAPAPGAVAPTSSQWRPTTKQTLSLGAAALLVFGAFQVVNTLRKKQPKPTTATDPDDVVDSLDE